MKILITCKYFFYRFILNLHWISFLLSHHHGSVTSAFRSLTLGCDTFKCFLQLAHQLQVTSEPTWWKCSLSIGNLPTNSDAFTVLVICKQSNSVKLLLRQSTTGSAKTLWMEHFWKFGEKRRFQEGNCGKERKGLILGSSNDCEEIHRSFVIRET